jgi:hypothetical protein
MNERARAMPESVARGEPLRGSERLEWARVNLEEAVARMVKHPDEKVYQVAVVARWRELDQLRGGIERREPAPKPARRPETIPPSDMPVAQPIEQRVGCPNCRAYVVNIAQHHTGTFWMCNAVNRSAPAPAPTEGF